MKNFEKKYFVFLYYVGLVVGTITMNYIIKQYTEISLSLIEQFQNLDKLEYVRENELFFYLLCKRVKQLLICTYLYLCVAKKLVLYVIDFCYAFATGAMITLFVHYNGIIGIGYAIILFLPITIFYGGIYYIAWLSEMQHLYQRKKAILIICLGGLGIMAEMVSSYLLG